MRRVVLRVLAMAGTLLPIVATAQVEAGVLVKVDLAQQQMTVDVDGKRSHAWPVSTARSSYVTPRGSFVPQRMHKIWYSRKYDNSPMPHAIFYSGGFAIHGTSSLRMLGRPASHGCVRLAPSNAAVLYCLVKLKGMAATRIVIHGSPPIVRAPALAHRKPAAPGARQRPTAVAAEPPGILSVLLGASEPTSAPLPRHRVAR